MQNPFQQQMMTGAVLGAQAFGQPQLQAQPTGFILPQQTAMPMNTNPFGLQAGQPQPQPTFQSFLAPQQTGFLQPQMTGSNPFRQSTLFPQSTGMPFGGQTMGAPPSTNPFPIQYPQNSSPFQTSPFGLQSAPPAQGSQPSFPFSNSFTGAPTPSSNGPTIVQPFAQPASSPGMSSAPPRSATAPLTAPGTSSSPPPAQPVKTHQTGSRNPFGQPVTPAPPVPKPPTLMEIAMGFGNQNNVGSQGPSQQLQQATQTGMFPGLGNFGSSFSAQTNGSTNQSLPNANANGSLMANIASSFALGNNDSSKPGSTFTSPLTSQPTSSTMTGSAFSDTLFSSLSSQPTGATSASSAPSISVSPAGGAPLQRQATGFSGLKPFKPSSSFGAALLDSLPPIPSAPSTPGGSPPSSNPGSTITSQTTGFPGLSGQPTGVGPSLGVGLRPQATGALGGANPFRASMFTTSSSPNPAGAGLGTTPSFLGSTSPPPTGTGGGVTGSGFGSTTSSFGFGGLGTSTTGAPSFGTGTFGSFGSGLNGINGLNDPSKQQQPQQQHSLI